MRKNILITGIPKSGKSSLLKGLIADIPNKTGFVTQEILGENGRVGFEIETDQGMKKILAHVDFETSHKVSRYFVDIPSLESIIPFVANFPAENLLYVDEIGQMQLFSSKFKDLVSQYLDSRNTCVATLSYIFEDEFTRSVKNRDDIILVEITPETREEKKIFITQLLKKITKAQTYISEPGRFSRLNGKVIVNSEHGIRNVISNDGKWSCDCDFYKKYSICSHVIATQELFK